MGRFINAGYENNVNIDKIIAILNSDSAPGRRLIRNAKETLKKDRVIGIFPEGTINRTKNIIMPFKIGSVKMAYDTNCYIIPFVITGKYKLFSKDLEIEFLPPYKPISNNEDLTEANQKLMKIIENKLKEKRN